ncbi:hypothetical protein [Promicromonospora aerolata]|uniref:Uncharacterized protein n=1 Tax=Promicromonospora aerolata TaxID=195749 RepID=A0ABW4V7I7_9MICO
MTVLAVPPRPATGGSVVAEFPAGVPSHRHTGVRYARVADPAIGCVLLDFEITFSLVSPETRVFTQAIQENVHEEFANGRSSVVGTIERLSALLGVPVKDVLAGAKIRKRTFQYWKRNPGTRPRLESQGEVWALAQGIEVLQEHLGEGLAHWMAQSPRRDMLRQGRYDELVQLATTPQGLDEELARRERARYVGDGDAAEVFLSPPSHPTVRTPPTRARVAKRAQVRGSEGM